MIKNIYFLKIYLTIITSLIITNLHSQNLNFDHYTINEGLSSSVVNCIFQDSEGYMWFGTQDGLNMFDGYNFKHFKNNPLDSLSLSDNWIYGITEDLNNDLWIASRAGVHKFNRKQSTFHLFKKNYEKIAYDLIHDTEGDIIINSLPFIIIINPNTNSYKEIEIDFEPGSHAVDQTQPIIQDKNGTIWIGNTAGLIKFNKKTSEYAIYKHKTNDPSSLDDNYITALLEDKEGKIWVCSQKGINIYNPLNNGFSHLKNQKKEFSFENLFIRSIYKDNKNNIWIGTEGAGLVKIKTEKDKLEIISIENFKRNISDPTSISNDIVLTVFQDKSEVLWLGTLAGIDKTDLKEKKFNLYRKSTSINSVNFLDNVIASIYKDIDDQLWIGNWGSGLNIYNRTTNTVEHYSSKLDINHLISDDYIHVIFKDSKSNIWIGTRNGIDIYNRDEKKFYSIQQYFKTENIPDFSNNRIFCIIEDDKNQIWVGTRNGLYVLNFKNSSYSYYSTDQLNGQSISDNLVYDLLQDKDGYIWIGTNNGLDLFDPDNLSITHFKRKESQTNTLCDNFIVSLCEDHNGDIWIGTKSGVNQFDKKDSTFYYYSELDGLPSNVVYEILLDDNNNLWFGTGKGLTTYNTQTKTFKTFDLEDGLQSLEFNLNAKFKADNGEIFFGGMNGLNSFYPNSISFNNYIPSIVITSFEKENKNGKQIFNSYETEEVTLNYNDYAFTIEFASLDYTHPQKNKYKYIVEELMENWIEIGNRRFVSFSNISPGTYTFKVMGTNNDGVWNQESSSLIITIKPPWWKTKIAYFAYFVSVFCLVIIYIKSREKKLIHEKKILEQKVQKRTSEISNQKEEIETQRDEIQAQRDYVTTQRDKIAKQNKDITNSILYAKRIQSALLPSLESLKNVFPDHFVYFMPRDIVSGDFYWIHKTDTKIYIAAADCTGHGVSGAFVSLLGISYLNEIIQKNHDSASDILEKLRIRIKTSLRHSGKINEPKDGMDIAFTIIDLKSKKLQFAGAYNPLIIIRDSQLIKLSGDKMPIGFHIKEYDFSNHCFDLKANDQLYMFSDGYIDQFGGIDGKKFLRSNFEKLLYSIKDKSMDNQKEILDETFNNWKGKEKQIDDILIMGMKI